MPHGEDWLVSIDAERARLWRGWRRAVFAPLIALMLMGVCSIAPSRPLHQAKTASLKTTYPVGFGRPTILLDPGHGGRQPGAVRDHSVPEKDINLRVARALETHLESEGRFHVELTRRGDSTLSIGARRRASRRLKPAVFVSIHANATSETTSNKKGVMVIASRRQGPRTSRRSEALARWVARSLKRQGFPLRDGARKPKRPHSFDYLAKAPGVWVTERRRLGVLRRNPRPAVLIETHYLDNPADVRAFQNDDAIGRFCRGVELALLNYLR